MSMDANAVFDDAMEKYYRAGSERDFMEVAILLQKASDAGHVTARVVIARMLIDGRLGWVDAKAGEEILISAANLGSASAANQLGVCHQLGKLGAPDLLRARDWYEKSALLGSAQALYNLGLLAELDPDEHGSRVAMKYFGEASEKGFPLATLHIARALLNRELSDRVESPKVRETYERAISQGSAEAAVELAELIELGRIGSYSTGLARHYYREAEKLGKSGLAAKIERLDNLQAVSEARRRPQRVKPQIERTMTYVFGIFLGALFFFPAIFGSQKCEDGWASPSIGTSGACSWHGGVDDAYTFWRLAFSIGVALLFALWHRR